MIAYSVDTMATRKTKTRTIEIGRTQGLRVTKRQDLGCTLDGLNLGEVFLPAPKSELDIDDIVDVFIYLDSDDRPIATDTVPLASVGQCAYLRVVSQSEFGSFLDWGLSKDLLVPFKEQRVPMKEGRAYVVFVYVDVTGRIAASSRLHRHLAEIDKHGTFRIHQEVELQIASRSDLGYSAVINGTHLGLIHKSELFQSPTIGQRVTGYIMSIRDDGRIDLSLRQQAPSKRAEEREALAERIVSYLQAHGGRSPLTDKSPPEDIYQTYNVSKSSYKNALGKLYKEKRILIEDGQITLV